MGAIIVKVAPDRDLYMRWSSVVDAPTHLGTRSEMAEVLLDDHTRAEVKDGTAALRVEANLARCDETGTTSRIGHPPTGGWDDSGLVWGWKARGYLPRAAFGELADRWLATQSGMPDITDLLTDIDDD